jgi:hypothetical protein
VIVLRDKLTRPRPELQSRECSRGLISRDASERVATPTPTARHARQRVCSVREYQHALCTQHRICPVMSGLIARTESLRAAW